jgi:hypothetical protein
MIRRFLFTSLASLSCLAVFILPESLSAAKVDQGGTPNFSGVWMLDRQSSNSLEPLMKNIGAGYLDRQYANSAALKATFHQTDQVLTVATRGPGFTLDERLDLDGRPRQSNQELLGATSLNVRTAWTQNRELIETRQIKTKQGKDGQLTIKRNLINDGKTMVVAFTLKLNAEPRAISVRQLWNKQA